MYTHEVVTGNRRRCPRFLISVPASLSRLGNLDLPVVHGLSLDLSRGGVSAVLCGPPAVGETVRLSLQFSGDSLVTLAIVRHSNSTRSGLEFVDLTPAHREQLERHIRTLEVRAWPLRGVGEAAFHAVSGCGTAVIRSTL